MARQRIFCRRGWDRETDSVKFEQSVACPVAGFTEKEDLRLCIVAIIGRHHGQGCCIVGYSTEYTLEKRIIDSDMQSPVLNAK